MISTRRSSEDEGNLIVHFFLALTDKPEICVTKQRWAKKYISLPRESR